MTRRWARIPEMISQSIEGCSKAQSRNRRRGMWISEIGFAGYVCSSDIQAEWVGLMSGERPPEGPRLAM
jgi:hypothetical protein